MHVNNVSDYAPGGYKLARTAYDDGKCQHVFSAEGKPDLVCELPSECNRDQERAALECFRALHEPLASMPVDLPSTEKMAASLPDIPYSSHNVAVARAMLDADEYTLGDYRASVDARRAGKLAELRAELDVGDTSPVSPDYSLEKVLTKTDATEKPKAKR